MQTLYRIYCEAVKRDTIIRIVNRHVQSFTIYPGIGYYDGIREQALVIECFSTT